MPRGVPKSGKRITKNNPIKLEQFFDDNEFVETLPYVGNDRIVNEHVVNIPQLDAATLRASWAKCANRNDFITDIDFSKITFECNKDDVKRSSGFFTHTGSMSYAHYLKNMGAKIVSPIFEEIPFFTFYYVD